MLANLSISTDILYVIEYLIVDILEYPSKCANVEVLIATAAFPHDRAGNAYLRFVRYTHGPIAATMCKRIAALA